jgi:hypothetical protein
MNKDRSGRRESLVFLYVILGLALACLYSGSFFDARALRLLLACLGIALFSFSAFLTSVFEYKRFGSIESRFGVIKPDQVRTHLSVYFIGGCICTAGLTAVVIVRLYKI